MVFQDKLYVSGRVLSSGDYAKLFVSSTDLDSWAVLSTPTISFAITTYHSQLVLIGGMETSTLEITNKLWSSDTGMDWEETLPPMPTKRCSASAVNTKTPECVVVAGGDNEDYLPSVTVEILKEGKWSSTKSIPRRCYDIKFGLHNQKLYLIGGYGQDNTLIQWCNVKTLIASCGHAQVHGKPDSPWNQLDLPLPCSSLASFGEHLVAIGMLTGVDPTGILACYLPLKEVWVRVGFMPAELRNTYSVVLSTGELVVIGVDKNSQQSGSRRVLKASLISKKTGYL